MPDMTSPPHTISSLTLKCTRCGRSQADIANNNYHNCLRDVDVDHINYLIERRLKIINKHKHS